MNQYQQSMDFFQTGYRVCFGIAIAALIIALILFFLFDIRTIFMIRTGRAQRRKVQEMEERNQRTGKLRDDTEKDLGSGTSDSGAKTLSRGKSLTENKTEKGKTKKAQKGSGRATQSMLDTMALSKASASEAGDFHFVVVQKEIITHTDERIAL